MSAVFLKGPDLQHRVSATCDQIPIHITDSLNRLGVAIREQGRLLHTRSIVNLR